LSRRGHLWAGAVSSLLALAIVFGVYELQLRHIEDQRTIDVIVPASFIPAGTLLEEPMLKRRPIVRDAFMEGMITDMRDAANMETMVPLGRDEPLLAWKLTKNGLMPGKDEATFQIPKSCVFSLSSHIRAGDRVVLFVSGPDGESARLFGREIKVASVKSAANVEIDDKNFSHLMSMAEDDRERMYLSRREANAAIDHVNLILKEEEWLAIDKICRRQEHKLVIAFSSALPAEVGS